MSAGPLRENQEAGDDEDGNHGRSDRAAQVQTALADGLVEEVAHGRAQWSCQDKRSPEQQNM